jgi:methyl coenzyme M reductase subunit C-like uncharacterized protein (methanogenesis marker protein 7)
LVRDKLLKIGIRLLSGICLKILSKAVLGVQDSFQIAVPIIELNDISQEDKATITIVRIYTLDLVYKKHFIKVDDLVLQFTSYSRKFVDIVDGFLKKAARQASVPVYPFDNVDDAVAIGLSLLNRITEHLQKSACEVSIYRRTHLQNDANLGLGKGSLRHGLNYETDSILY